MVGHRGMSQQLSHAIVMFARRSDEEPPELASLRIKHAQLECNTQKGRQRFETVILVRLGNILRYVRCSESSARR
jgi:hypothetical protein